MNDYDFWEEQERAEQEYDAQQQAITDAYDNGYQRGRADAIVEMKSALELRDAKIQFFTRDKDSMTLHVHDADWLAEQIKEKKNE